MLPETPVLPETPFIIARARVTQVERVSPSFARISFAGPDIARFGNPGRAFDQRIKLIFPPESGALPELGDIGADWYRSWLALPEANRGSMRTYSIRYLSADTLVIDFVLHLQPGLTGPASLWASSAAAGDELLIIGPRRGLPDWGGVEFAPGDAQEILLAGDETAAPAIARILEDADASVRGIAFIEVPDPSDALAIDAPYGVQVRWLPRGAGQVHGEQLIPAVLDYLGAQAEQARVQIEDVAGDELVWETPQFSGLGEDILESAAPHGGRYFWIAGESAVVTTLRRHLVRELGIDRTQVAFMGYWRTGVAMRG